MSIGPDGSAASNYQRLFRNGNYLRVFVAGVGSIAGQALAGVCLVWLVYAQTGSAVAVGLLGASGVIGAAIFSVFGGTLVDRYDRRRLMVLADLLRAAAMAAVVVAEITVGFDLAVVLVAAFAIGAFTTLFNPAEQSIIPALVEGPLVADANGLVRSSRSAVQFAGASVAGVLIVTVGPVWGLGVNVATFLFSAFLLVGLTVVTPRRADVASTVGSYLKDVRAGFRWLWGAQGFFQLTLSATFFNFCSTIIATFLVFYATEVLHGTALDYALLLAVEVAGVGLGSLLVARTGAVRYAGRAWTIPYGVCSGAVAILLATVPDVPVAVVSLFVLGLLGGFAGTAWLTAAQILVPSEMQGRYFGIDNLGSVAIIPVAQIGGAFLLVAVGVQEAYLVTAIVWLVAGALFLAPRALWQLGVPPERPAQVP